jgi:uncharacterized membrane protein
MMRVLIISVAAGAITAAASAQTPGFWLVGMPPQATAGQVAALSQDGSMAAGGNYWISPQGSNVVGFTWSAAGGRYDFGFEPGMPQVTTVQAMSSDGSVVAGHMVTPTPWRAYRRVGNGPLEDLGSGGWFRSEAQGISGDGNTVVGWGHGGSGFGEAFRWTPSGGYQPLGYARPLGTTSSASAISRDGTTIVGMSQSNGLFGNVEAFRWTEAGGMQVLPNLPGAPFVSYEAEAVNLDGSVIVGVAPIPGARRAVRWTSTGIEDLGTLSGYTSSRATAVSDDGLVVSGYAYSSGTIRTPFLWTPTEGMRSLSDTLQLHGVTIPSDIQLREVLAISGDGTTFAGFAFNTSLNRIEGFVATIPAPATSLVLLAPLVAMRRRRAP